MQDDWLSDRWAPSKGAGGRKSRRSRRRWIRRAVGWTLGVLAFAACVFFGSLLVQKTSQSTGGRRVVPPPSYRQ